MNPTRRDLSLLLSALAANPAAAQAKALSSQQLKYDDFMVKSNGENRSRAILNGETHSGYPIEMHETELAPGAMPHPPHRHVNEEAVYIREGTLEVTIADRTSRLGPGSVVYVASNEFHGWKNAGPDRAKYLVVALGPKK